MRKIPTLYVRDFEGTLGPPGRFVLPELHPDCGWVVAGEGVATRKIDGTCCLIEGGNLYRRHEVKTDKRTGKFRPTPDFFRPVETDPETGHIVGWVPILPANPADVHHWEAFAQLCKAWRTW